MGAEGTTPSVCDISLNISPGCSVLGLIPWFPSAGNCSWLQFWRNSVYTEPAPHSPWSPKPENLKFLEFRGGTGTGIWTDQECIFQLPVSFLSGSLAVVCFPLQFWEATALSCIQGFAFQFKVGVTQKTSFFKSWKVPRLHLGGSRAKAGIDLACPCSLGFRGKELYSFHCQITKFHEIGSSTGRPREGGHSPPWQLQLSPASVCPFLSDSSAFHPSCSRGTAWGRQRGAAINPSAPEGKASMWQEKCRTEHETQIRQQHPKGHESRFFPLPIKLPLSKSSACLKLKEL